VTLGLVHGLLYLAPALALWLLLARGRYPGESAIARLARRGARRRTGAPRPPWRRSAAPDRARRRRPLVDSLAGRAPPGPPLHPLPATR
jgi:hypothetical protein